MAIEHVRFECPDGDTLEVVGDPSSATGARQLRDAERQARTGCPKVTRHKDGVPVEWCGKKMRRVAVDLPAEVVEPTVSEAPPEHDGAA